MPGSNRKYPLDKTESIFSSFGCIIMWEKASPYLKSLKFFPFFANYLPSQKTWKISTFLLICRILQQTLSQSYWYIYIYIWRGLGEMSSRWRHYNQMRWFLIQVPQGALPDLVTQFCHQKSTCDPQFKNW